METVNINNKLNKKKELSSKVVFLMNFALFISIIYTIGLMPYAYIKGLFPIYFYIIFIFFIITYVIFWWLNVIKNIREKKTFT